MAAILVCSTRYRTAAERLAAEIRRSPGPAGVDEVIDEQLAGTPDLSG